MCAYSLYSASNPDPPTPSQRIYIHKESFGYINHDGRNENYSHLDLDSHLHMLSDINLIMIMILI
jgi:hypothetical protein